MKEHLFISEEHDDENNKHDFHRFGYRQTILIEE